MRKGADGIEALTQRHDAFQGQAARSGFQPHQIVPSGGQADRAASVRTDCGRGKTVGDRGRSARGRPSWHGLVIIDAGRGGGDRVEAQTGEGEFGHMGFTKANKALACSGLQNLGVSGGGAAFQQGRSRLGRGARGVEKILPAERHTVKRATAQAGFGAGGGAHGLASGAGFGGAGEDAGGVAVAGDFIKEKFGQLDRIDAAFFDISAQFGSRHIGPSFAHHSPRFCDHSGKAAHGQSRSLGHIGGMEYDADIVIVGGGLNGPALGLALAQGGLRVAVVDARPADARAEAGFDGRAYALSIASKRLLGAIGVWGALADKVQPILQIKASDGVAGQGPAPFFLTFDAAEIEEGPMGFMCEDRHLYAAFLAAMREAGVELISGESVVAQEVGEGVSVTLASGRSLRARVLVGCDGRGSGVALRAGIKRTGWGYGQTALVTAIAHEADHGGVAQQYFLPSGPLAILPLAGGHHSSIVWSEEAAAAAAIQALPDAEYLEALRPRVGGFLGQISLAGARFTYPLSLSLANSFTAKRVALVGDAAHGVHPIAGQGLNLGLRDVGALAEVLIEAHRRGEDIGAADVLERYQRWRRFDSTALALGMDGVNRLFSNDNPILRAGRDLGLGLVNAVPALRRGFMRQAAGLTGDVPKLLQGRAI